MLRSHPDLVECSSLECLRDNLGRCLPSHYYSADYCAEGAPVYDDAFVLRGAWDSCWVVSYTDHTQNYWGGCRVIRRVCPTVDASMSNEPERFGCGPLEVLLEVTPCRNPYDPKREHPPD